MTELNELSSEVAEFASKLGLAVNANPYSEFDPKGFQKSSGNGGTNLKRKTRTPRQKSDHRNSKSISQRQKPKSKGDHYDKAALLRILSGPEESPKTDLKRLKKAKSILPGSSPLLWHVAVEDLGELKHSENQETPLDQVQIHQKKQQALKLLQNEKDAYDFRLHSSKQQGKWLLQIREQGTHADKIAALSLQIRDAVVANINELDVLLNIAEKQKGSKQLVISALKALTELFRCYLLPDRKLIPFEKRPLQILTQDQGSKLRLIYWFIEDLVKVKFARFVLILESASMAPLDHLRSEAVTLVSTLLYDRPEQEAQLLRILIHKLGEKTKKTGSKVAFLISKLITKHPRMKLIVLREAEKFVYLTGTTIRSIQRVLQVFNLVTYEHNDSDKSTATKFINLCFSLFQLMIDGKIGSIVDLEHKKSEAKLAVHKRSLKASKKGPNDKSKVQELDATVFNALIVGVRRSLPFADHKELGHLLEKHLVALFRITHIAPIGVGIQIIALLLQVSNSTSVGLDDRLYRVIYEKLLDSHLAETRKLPLFISTLFKGLKQDPVLSRTTAFVKRILQVSLNAEPQIHSAFLLLISELLKFKPGLKNGIVQGEDPGQTGYRIDAREPKFCGASDDCYWELSLNLTHYHPVVQSMSTELLSNQSIASRGDPLQELTHFAFLEKLVTGKDAKLKSIGSGIDPQITPGASLHHKSIESQTLFSSLASQEIPVEDVFFHKYFNLQGVKKDREARQNAKNRKKGKLQEGKQDVLLEDSDELESLDDSEIPDPEIDSTELDQMFKSAPERPLSAQLYDYSSLMNDLEDAYEDEERDEESDEEFDLSALQFPDCDSLSEEDSESSPPPKRSKKIKKAKKDSDFAPAEDFADILESD